MKNLNERLEVIHKKMVAEDERHRDVMDAPKAEQERVTSEYLFRKKTVEQFNVLRHPSIPIFLSTFDMSVDSVRLILIPETVSLM